MYLSGLKTEWFIGAVIECMVTCICLPCQLGISMPDGTRSLYKAKYILTKLHSRSLPELAQKQIQLEKAIQGPGKHSGALEAFGDLTTD